jgi:putative ABC transport system ATP-binding protein
MSAVLEARELYRFFHTGDDEVLALRGVSLAVEAGEIVAVVGPSGSGKSTLLACLAGLDEPDGGSVDVAGERMTRRPEAWRARLRARHVGVLSQTGNLVDHLTVGANVLLAQRLAGRPDRGRCHAVLDAVGLTSRADAAPASLSGGEAARAGLALALANDPAVLLADEPTGEVDAGNERRVLALLRQRAGTGTAVVVVTHSDAVAGAADRIVILRNGRVDA